MGKKRDRERETSSIKRLDNWTTERPPGNRKWAVITKNEWPMGDRSDYTYQSAKSGDFSRTLTPFCFGSRETRLTFKGRDIVSATGHAANRMGEVFAKFLPRAKVWQDVDLHMLRSRV